MTEDYGYGRRPIHGQRPRVEPEYDNQDNLEVPQDDGVRGVPPGHPGIGQQLVQEPGRLPDDGDAPQLGGMRVIDNRRPKDPKSRWKLYFTFCLPVKDESPALRLWTDSEMAARHKEVNSLAEDIEANGLRNPVIAVRGPNGSIGVHPGKARMAAVEALGWDVIPAIVVDYSNHPAPPEWEAIEFSDLPAYLTEDFEANASWRYLGIYSV